MKLGPVLILNGAHEDHGLCCPAVGPGAPSKTSHKLSDVPMEVPLAKRKNAFLMIHIICLAQKYRG